MCALWANIDDETTDTLTLMGYDIVNGQLEEYPEQIPVK